LRYLLIAREDSIPKNILVAAEKDSTPDRPMDF
jgi:hypothetical protein